ncbi:sulfotransferase family protein [Marinobacterium aestuariivivens]|uniref:Sulfotransferase family protein n=1 Tax=Marinobacterium aestuariivivens TaxID=1698799 RepID=A0ABW1ZU73_9GAMM
MNEISDIGPCFLVGPPRSGTTLLTAMLNTHSLVGAGPETHFFSKIKEDEWREMLADPDWPKKAVDKISSVKLVGQNVIGLFEISSEDLYDTLTNCERSINAVLNGFFSIYLNKKGKSIWVEKTPNHLLFLDLIRKEFPKAKIIRIVRDPRDSCNSMSKLNWTYHPVSNAYIWNEWFEKSRVFLKTIIILFRLGMKILLVILKSTYEEYVTS